MKKETLLRYCGSMEQVARVRPISYRSGRADGLNAVEVKNGPMEFVLMQDKCLDMAYLSYKGINIGVLTKPGLQGRNPYDTNGEESLRSIMGGAMFTCGFENIHGCREIDGQSYPMHGRMRTTPMEKLCMDAFFQEDDYVLQVSGEGREACLFGENMVLRRTVRTVYGTSTIIIRDEIENQAFRPEPLCFLYHINAGYPFLCSGCRFLIPYRECEPANDAAREGMERRFQAGEPVDNAPENVYLYTLAADQQGNTLAAIVNDEKELALCVRWNVEQIPCLTQWKSMASGDYAAALEPCNSGFDSRESASTQILQPLQTHVNEFSITILDTKEQIAALEQELRSLTK